MDDIEEIAYAVTASEWLIASHKERAARIAAALRAERERCAKLCEGDFDSEMRSYGDYFAAAIRRVSPAKEGSPE